MQKLILFFMLCFIINIAHAQTELAVSNTENLNTTQANTAKLILYRPYALGNCLYSPKLILGAQKVRLKNRHLLELEIPVGDYSIKNKDFTIFTRKIGFNLNVEAGKTYYVRYRVLSDIFIAIDEFIQVEENFAKQEIAKGKFKTKK